MQKLKHISVRSATGSNLTPLGMIHCSFELGKSCSIVISLYVETLPNLLYWEEISLLQHHITVRYAADGKCILD